MYGSWTLGWEKLVAKSATPNTYSGSYTTEGVRNTGGSYAMDLQVQPAATADTFDLVYQGNTNRYEGIGLSAGDRLAFARWGVKVTKTERSWGADQSVKYTTTTENRDHPHVWLGAYRISADRLDGRLIDGDTKQMVSQVFAKGRP